MTTTEPAAPRNAIYYLELACRCFGWIGVRLESATPIVSCAVCGTRLTIRHYPDQENPR